MPRDLLRAIALGMSMLGGVIVSAFCCFNPLAHGTRVAEFNLAVIVLGA